MKYKLNDSLDKVIEFLENQINELENSNDISKIVDILNDVSNNVSKYINSQELVLNIRKSSNYISNPFSDVKNKEAINQAKKGL